MYLTKEGESFIAEIPFDSVFREAPSIQLVIESPSLYSHIVDEQTFLRAQQQMIEYQSQHLARNPALQQLLSSQGINLLSRSGAGNMAQVMEATPGLYYDYDELESITPSGADAVNGAFVVK